MRRAMSLVVLASVVLAACRDKPQSSRVSVRSLEGEGMARRPFARAPRAIAASCLSLDAQAFARAPRAFGLVRAAGSR
jgi:hypothetical protein